MPTNESDYTLRQMGSDAEATHRVLSSLLTALSQWIIPFLERWSTDGPQPLVSGDELARLHEFVRSIGASPPEGYTWLPGFLERLATAMRFNRRNFVNIHPTPFIPSLAASIAVALQNPNNIVPEVSRATTAFEQECIEWLATLVGFKDPPAAWGNIVSGGTIANITALLVARDYTYRKLARPRAADVRTRGLFDRSTGVILASAGSHYSVRKAAWVLGLGDENVVTIPVAYDEAAQAREEQDAMFVGGVTDPTWRDLLHDAIRVDRELGAVELTKFYEGAACPFTLQPLNSEVFKAMYACFTYGTPLIAYVFTLGTTDTGTIEMPNSEALRRLAAEDVFIHADAAAGGFALMHRRVAGRAVGLENVHSVTLDAHKLGQLAYPNGAIVFRDRGWVYEIMHEAPYLVGLAPTIEGSRWGGSAAALWAAIQDIGQAGYAHWLDRMFAFVDALVDAFTSSGVFQVLHEVHLTSITVAPRPRGNETRRELNTLVRRVHDRVREDIRAGAFLVNLDRGLASVKVRNVPGSTTDDELIDIHCLRIVVANPAVETVDAALLVNYLCEHLEAARR